MKRKRKSAAYLGEMTDIFEQEWLDEEQAILMAMLVLECTVEEAALAVKEFKEEYPDLVLKAQ